MEGIDYDLCMAIKFIYDEHIFTVINTGFNLEYYLDGQHWFDTYSVVPTGDAINLGIESYEDEVGIVVGQEKTSV